MHTAVDHTAMTRIPQSNSPQFPPGNLVLLVAIETATTEVLGSL